MAGKPLAQHTVCIDLPGDPVDCSANTDVTVLLRKHRDVLFDVKLGNNATYTVTSTHSDRRVGRFYDRKRKMNVVKTTFTDGEQCHIWVGRNFEGSLVLKQGDKELGRYPISKMDCTNGCTEDPKDKPAPLLIVMHDDKAFARSLQKLSDIHTVSQSASAPIAQESQTAAAPVTLSDAKATSPVSRNVLPTVHAIKIKQTQGPTVPSELRTYFSEGGESFDWDPLHTISRNFLFAQIGAAGGYFFDAFGKDAPLQGFWNRKFIIRKMSTGEFVMFFRTTSKEKDILGFLLTAYRGRPNDVRIMTLAGGVGSLSSATRAAWTAANASINVKTMTGKAMGLAIIMDTMSWWHDYETVKPDGSKGKDFADLLATIGVDTAQMWIATYATTTIIAAIIASTAVLATGAATTPVWVIALGSLAIIWFVNTIVAAPFNQKDKDDKTIGDHLAADIRSVGTYLEKTLASDYPETYSQSTWHIDPLDATP
ncbi:MULTISPECIES: hypothetical protein [unclassified Paraburkholderia]|uniref:hypothetical protein n=1 Tax=unclassified Paraburkholderia TaxID=2615204 RepID=UPI002AB2F240|nr:MULTISPECIES: hypothetical protein [unclassified Paraburkholderia]